MLLKGGESINISCVTKDINIASNKKCQFLTNFRSILFFTSITKLGGVASVVDPDPSRSGPELLVRLDPDLTFLTR